MRNFLARILSENLPTFCSHVVSMGERSGVSIPCYSAGWSSSAEFEAVVYAASEIIRRRDVESPTAWAARVRKAKKMKRADGSRASLPSQVENSILGHEQHGMDKTYLHQPATEDLTPHIRKLNFDHIDLSHIVPEPINSPKS
jgi:hypothetical protein